MVSIKPCLSIGLPVFNGEKYIDQAIDSILSQTYRDFELIISDNASSDRTADICLEYAERDGRVSYHRNKRNFGASWNYNQVFKLSSGKYFKWAAHDDVLAPEYLEKCVRVLDNDPSIVLVHSRTARIDEHGTVVGNYDNMTLSKIGLSEPHERFSDLISLRNSCWIVFGVVRANSFRKTPLHGNYILADRNLLAEIGLMGRIYEIPEHLFLRRDHPEAYTRTYYSKPVIAIDYSKQLEWWNGEKTGTITVLPHWKHCLEFFRSVRRVPLNWLEKWHCYEEIGKWILGDGWGLMRWDLANAFKLWRIQLNR